MRMMTLTDDERDTTVRFNPGAVVAILVDEGRTLIVTIDGHGMVCRESQQEAVEEWHRCLEE